MLVISMSVYCPLQACYLPLGPDASPVIGPVPDHPGAYVVSGAHHRGVILGLTMV
jgi:glycine/D-amino acid oxidase-like deaminating enzyme